MQLSPESLNELNALEAQVREGLGEAWGTISGAAGVRKSKDARRAFILISAHLLRIPVENPDLRDGAPNTNLDHSSN